ncbi:uroporphyrinogen decarboxylase family protein [Azospirillum sp. B506]|uniref:uroporphyrinogen decarboxylase family protein n=1 Tax=Azospirillum sp. B506 TaxID=137721 RepID=UPI000344AC51|nr:uroporphyrinogen decarboxylase family protein [Azospirillum sp. B506]
MEYSQNISTIFAGRERHKPLFSFWTHFPDIDLDPQRLADATIGLQRTFDLDFVKTAPNGMYAIEDYGVGIDFSEVGTGGIARITSTPFERAEDWDDLPDLDIHSGALGRELRSLRLVRAALPDIPIVFTVFSPMTIAAKLSRGAIRTQIRDGNHAREIHGALGKISRLVSRYSAAAIEAGADGVFFAHQDTGRDRFPYDDFSEYVAAYDLEALFGARSGRFNILHIHGEQIRFRELLDYPVHGINWHSWETLPSMAGGLLSSRKCIVGGIDRRSVTANDIPAIEDQIRSVSRMAEGVGNVIFAPSCTIRAGFRPETLHAIRSIVKGQQPRRGRTLQAAWMGAALG